MDLENTALPKLKISVFGGFSASYGEKALVFGRNTVTKAMKLLQILLYRGEEGIARDKLLEDLYGHEELTDSANNLRVTAHRLKKILAEAGLPKHDYIEIKKGIYRWSSPMETEVDARIFERLYAQAENAVDTDEKIALLEQVCSMYKGEFLPDLSGDGWVLLESVHYKKIYSQALRDLSELLLSRNEYEETLAYVTPACQMYPFDEWQSVRIDCYMGLRRYKDAMKEYEDTAKLFFEELGINPSGKMMRQFEQMSSHLNYRTQAIIEIQERLKGENQAGGAYYCSFPSFRDSYRLVSRIIERNGQSVFLMLCSITDGKGQQLDNQKKLEILSEELHNSILHCLRRGDSFTKYSPSQFLILLVGTNKENCSLIYDRIRNHFTREHRSWALNLRYYVSSVAEVGNESSPIQFESMETKW